MTAIACNIGSILFNCNNVLPLLKLVCANILTWKCTCYFISNLKNIFCFVDFVTKSSARFRWYCCANHLSICRTFKFHHWAYLAESWLKSVIIIFFSIGLIHMYLLYCLFTSNNCHEISSRLRFVNDCLH